MRNLVVFLIRHYFFLLFLLLEGLSVYFLVQQNYFQRAAAVSATNNVTGSLYETRNELTSYFNLKQQNDALNAKLAELLSRDSASFMKMSAKTITVNDTVYQQRYEFVPALVIDNTVGRRNNYIILNRGKLQGIAPDMGVISAQGIVGIVREVSDHFCLVMSVLHKDSRISASLKKDGTFGQLLWEGDDYDEAKLVDLPTHSKIAVGDLLVTSGFGDAFPKGVAVGTVKSFEKKAGEKTYTVRVKLATDFKKIGHVLIVKNLMVEELKDLRQKMDERNDK
ncbi:MAG: rod shape-determining protein MreC [Bacteroidia bacterium]